jgi:hypothetical protein
MQELLGLPRQNYTDLPAMDPTNTAAAPSHGNEVRVWDFLRFSFVSAVMVAVVIAVLYALIVRHRRLAAAAQHMVRLCNKVYNYAALVDSTCQASALLLPVATQVG